MPGEVALRLLLKGQREMSAALGDITKQGGELGKTFDKASGSAKRLSGGLDAVEKQGVGATRSTRALLVATKQVADAQQAAAAASAQAAEVRLKAAAALADATTKQAAGDVEGAKAARDHAVALQQQATAANRSAIAMRASASAARDQVTAIKASTTAANMAAGSGGGMSRLGMLGKVGGVLTKTGLAAGAYLGYQGVKRVGTLEDTVARLGTLANVPKGQIPSLQAWMLSQSPGLREDPNTLATQMYRIASASPGHPYGPRELERLTRAAAMFSTIGGSGTDPEQAARIFGIIRANGGLGTKNYRQIGGIATATIGAGDMTASDYIAALGTGGLAVNAARHKISLTQLGGVLAEMGDLGVTGSMAGTRVQHAISLLASPSAAASKIYGSLGISPTMIDQVIRTKGLGAGMALLQRQMRATMPANMVGQTATTGDLMSVGYSRRQAAAMRKQGPASMEDLLLTRAFGGARQATPIIALLNGLNRTSGKTAEVARAGTAGQFSSKFATAANTPAQTWHRFDLDLQQLENNIGLKLIPKLEAMGNWFSRNETAVKDVATALGVLAIPAIGAYAATLAMKALTATQNFTTALRGQNTQLSTVGQTAAAQSRGVGTLGTAVMGVTTAIGVFELGRATGSHGAGGALTAGLGGAIAGMTIGMTAGPWGAAIGAAGGALIGLAGHFSAVKTEVDKVNAALDSYTQQLDQAFGTSAKGQRGKSRQLVLSQLQAHPQVLASLKSYGVSASDIVNMGLGKGPVGPALSAWENAMSAGPPGSARASMQMFVQELEAAITGAITNAANLNSVANGTATTTHGHLTTHSHHPGRSGPVKQGQPGDIVLHNHVHLDGKDIYQSVHRHQRKQLARL